MIPGGAYVLSQIKIHSFNGDQKMSNACLDLLIELIDRCHIPQEEFLEAIRGVHYYSALPSPTRSRPASACKRTPSPMTLTTVSTTSAAPVARKGPNPLVYEADLTVRQPARSMYRNYAAQQCTGRQAKTQRGTSRSLHDFLNRTAALTAKQERRKKQREMASREDEGKVCTFRPNISQTESRSRSVASRGKSVGERLYGLDKVQRLKNEARRARRKAEVAAEEIVECSFQPRVLCPSSGGTRSRFMIMSSRRASKPKVWTETTEPLRSQPRTETQQQQQKHVSELIRGQLKLSAGSGRKSSPGGCASRSKDRRNRDERGLRSVRINLGRSFVNKTLF